MRILCVSDQIDPLVYSNMIRERFSDVDCILSAGDLPMDYLDFIISNLNKPLYFVFGNHNLDQYAYYHPDWDDHLREKTEEEKTLYGTSGAIYIESKVQRENNLIIAGLGGSMRYNKGKNQFSNFEMYLEIFKIIPKLLWNKVFHGRFLDILLTHAPPKGIHDREDRCHTGFSPFLWFMRAFKPKFLVHGHIHLYDMNETRNTQYYKTKIVNAYSHYIIDTGDK
jgi:uncharacterized protein